LFCILCKKLHRIGNIQKPTNPLPHW